MSPTRTLIVGIGSPHGDDQAGWQVAERLLQVFDNADLKAKLDEVNVVVRCATTPIQLIDWLEEVDCLVLCDACRGVGRVGEVRRWEWPASELANVAWSGTHDFSLPAVLELAGCLGRLPPCVIIWSVEGQANDALAAVSQEVAAALPAMIEEIANDVTLGLPSKDHRCTNNHS